MKPGLFNIMDSLFAVEKEEWRQYKNRCGEAKILENKGYFSTFLSPPPHFVINTVADPIVAPRSIMLYIVHKSKCDYQ